MVYSALSDDSSTVSQFTRRKKITVTTDGTSIPADYQVKLTITFELGMEVSFADIRFNTKAGAYIDMWQESHTDSTTADIWVKLPDAITHPGSDTIWMYYGNASLSDGGVGDDTFTFFDDFPGSTIDTNKWDVKLNDGTAGGSVSVTNSEVTLDNDDMIISKTAYGYDYVVTSKAKADEQDTTFVAFALTKLFGWNDQVSIVNSDLSSDNFDRFDCVSSVGETFDSDDYADGQSDFRNTYYKYTIKRKSGEVKYYQEDNLLYTRTTTLPTSDMYVAAATWDSTQESTLIVDWFFVRKYIANEPIPLYGSAQHQRRVPQFIG